MRRQPLGFFVFVLNRLMSKQRSLRLVMTSSTRDVEIAFCKRSRETARELSSMSAHFWYIVGMVRREEDAEGK